MVCTYLLVCIAMVVYSQKNTIPSLKSQLANHINDTTSVELLRKLGILIQPLRPDSALIYMQQGLNLARKIDYKKGEADCMNSLGVILWKNGKYDSALSYSLSSLKLREEIKDRLGVLKSLNDIGIIYSDLMDYVKALSYYFKAKTIAESLHDKKRLSIVFSNIGNCYIKLKKKDSALNYEMQAYEIQQAINDQGTLPNTLSILGDIHYKMGQIALALDYYRLSVLYAAKDNDQNELADTYNSIAKLYKKSGMTDSSIFYATRALNAAKAALYPEGIYHAGELLTQIYQGKNDHLELLYLKMTVAAKDSMFNAERIKQVQTLSFNEAARQEEIVEEKHREAEDRIVNLQLIGIAIFIPFFFLALLLLSKSRMHRKVIEFMSVLSLLLVFEFVTLFIHPFVQRITNHRPVFELLILVGFAAVIIPFHHRLTHWLREKLAHVGQHPTKQTDTRSADIM
jgi:tetratricopeptide (TPR) repeat protein